MSRRRGFAIVLCLIMVVGSAVAQQLASSENSESAPAPGPKPIAFVGGLIRTQTDRGDFVGTIIIADGKIAAAGVDAAIPADAVRIDASTYVITPGLIDAHSVTWLQPAAAREGGRDGLLNILDGIDPFAEDWREVARHGVTAVYVQPSSAGSLGGSGAVVRVAPIRSVDDIAIKSPAGLQVALGGTAPPPAPTANPLAEILARLGINLPATPAAAPVTTSNSLTRFTQYESLRGQFDAAKKYGESKPARPDHGKELILKAIKREIPVRLEIAHEDDIRNALALTNDYGLRTVFERLDGVKLVPEEMAATRHGIVIGPLLGVKSNADQRKLALDGRRFAIGTFGDDPKSSAWLRTHAAAAIADGFSADAVLRALTADAAELNGAGDKLGRIAVGRPADLAVFAGDPLDPSVPVRMTLSQGIVTYDNPAAVAESVKMPSKVTLPDQMPSAFVLKTNRLLKPTGDFEAGELFIEAGRITDRANRSPEVPIFDVGDAPITPGLVAGHTVVATEESPDADAGQFRAGCALSCDDAKLRLLRDAGYLTALVAPSSENIVSGMTCAVATCDAMPIGDCAMKFVLAPAARVNERYPVSLGGQFDLIASRLKGSPSSTNLYVPAAVQRMMLAERDRNLASCRERRIAAWFEAHSRAEVAAALRLIEQYKLRGVIVAPSELDELADQIRGAGAALIAAPAKPQTSDRLREAYAVLSQSGVPVAFTGEPAEMRTTLSWMVNGGMSRSAARRALIAQPPERFGMPASCGRLSAGDSADIVVWDGDPVNPASRPVAVIAKGRRLRTGT